jgi:hypothetical protein
MSRIKSENLLTKNAKIQDKKELEDGCSNKTHPSNRSTRVGWPGI